jgi:hypothetical protein
MYESTSAETVSKTIEEHMIRVNISAGNVMRMETLDGF